MAAVYSHDYIWLVNQDPMTSTRTSIKDTPACPSSLSLEGKLRVRSKASLVPCLDAKTRSSEGFPVIDASFLEDGAVVKMWNRGIANTLFDYTEQVFVQCTSTA